MKFFFYLSPIICLLFSCAEYGKVSFSESPQIINVSEYDPKERQRSGQRFTPENQKALAESGALGMIARTGKGTHIDTKCARFLAGAERSGLMLGTYFYVLPRVSTSWQAKRYVDRLSQIKASYPFRTQKVLLVADFDTNCSMTQITTFLREIKRITGVTPVVYLENSDKIRKTLNRASFSDKAYLRKHPYWLALYSSDNSNYPTPKKLANGSGIWKTWAMWQYGGVWWKNGRSRPYNYKGGNWNTPSYFGNLSHPCERSGFNGTKQELLSFWDKHSWNW